MKNKILIAILLGVFVFYPLAFWYELHKIETFCKALSTEIKVENLVNFAKDYGVESKYGAKTLKNGIKDKDGTYTSFVASMFTMGDTKCLIKHDGSKIITANYVTY